MEPYYSSDEEVAWGPLTVPEIKKGLQENRKVTHRESDVGHYAFYTPSTTFTEESGADVENKTATSVTSTFHTANSSLESPKESASKSNDLFLEKLSKVIEGENCKEVDVAIPTCDTLLNILNAEEGDCGNLENIQQTLVNNTIEPSADDYDEKKIIINTSPIEISSGDESDEVIILSDNSDDCVSESGSPNKSFKFNPACMKIEKESTPRRSILDMKCGPSTGEIMAYVLGNMSKEEKESLMLRGRAIADSEDSTEKDFACEEQEYSEDTIEQENASKEKESLEMSSSFNNQKMSVNEDFLQESSEDTSKEQENRPEETEESSEDTSKEQENISEEAENQETASYFNDHKMDVDKDFREGSENCDSDAERNFNAKQPYCRLFLGSPESNSTVSEHDFEIHNSQHDLENRSGSPVFNDTIEEMEMALKEGLDYIMPGDDSAFKNPQILTPHRHDSYKATGIPKLKTIRHNRDKFDYIRSPVGDYIKKKVPNDDNFKLPFKPAKHKITPNLARSPLVQSNHFKNIESPVGIYIKNSPGCLKQNIPINTVPMLKPTKNCELVKESKENNFSIPEVVYKPSKTTVTSTKTKSIVLPSSIQKLVKERVITKHEARVKGNVDESGVGEKLLQDNLTVADLSVSNQSSEDISFVNVKQAFIK